MELREAAASRVSIRDFKEDTVIEKSVLEELIRFAQLAPSWKNSQTARYYVVVDADKVAELKEKTLPNFNQKSSAGAPVLIVTTFEKNISGHSNGEPDNEIGNEWGAYDLGLANGYLELKARELGLDTLIMGIRDAKSLRQILSIPDSQEVVAVLAVGYRKEDVPARPRKALEEVAVFQ